MKYHLTAGREATPENWQIMLRAFACVPRKRDEGAYAAMLAAASAAQIMHNTRSEMLAFLDSCWDAAFTTQYGIPTFETSAPHNFRLIREQWSLTIVLRYADYSGGSEWFEKIYLSVRSKDPERVRAFAQEAAKDLGHEWYGSLHQDNQHSISPMAAQKRSVDHAIDALIASAKQRCVATS